MFPQEPFTLSNTARSVQDSFSFSVITAAFRDTFETLYRSGDLRSILHHDANMFRFVKIHFFVKKTVLLKKKKGPFEKKCPFFEDLYCSCDLRSILYHDANMFKV